MSISAAKPITLPAAALAAVLLLAACATTAPVAQAPVADATRDPSCLTSTGSRIPAAKGACTGTGQSYTNEDISRTGATTAGDALRLLSPSVTISH